jgi:HTH-type transcriptional regulator/antitoxin HigA
MSQIRMELSYENEYQPDVVSAPGETLQEILDDRQMTQTELADRLGLTHKTVNEIIKGKAPISPESALALELVLDIPARFWNSYEAAYQEYIARKAVDERLGSAGAWLSSLPWRDAARLGWIEIKPTIHEQVREVLRFFGVASPTQYEEVYAGLAVQWRRSTKFKSDPNAIAFWLRRAELVVQEMRNSTSYEWGEYDPRKFEQAVLAARAITFDLDMDSCIERLAKLCAPAGVAVVFVPEVDGTRASGATRWLSPTVALVQLSLRGKRNDIFWFDFMHECAHVLKHAKKKIYLEGAGADLSEQEEREANKFAQDSLIPPTELARLLQRGKPSMSEVEAFADRIGVDPAIVVGRLRHDDVIRPNEYRAFIQYYRIVNH